MLLHKKSFTFVANSIIHLRRSLARLAIAVAMLVTGAAIAQTVDDLRGQLKKHWDAKDWLAAEDISRRITAEQQSTASDWRNLANVLRMQNKSDEFAVRQEAVKRPGATSDDFNSICWHQIERNRPLDARPECERAVSLKADNWGALVNLGHTWLLAGDKAKSQEWYRRALPYIQKDEELRVGPLEDFALFVKNGWVEADAEAGRQWFEQSWSTLKELRQRRFAATNDTSTLVKSAESMKALLGLRKQVIGLVGDGEEADKFLARYSLVASSTIRKLVGQDHLYDQAIAFVDTALQSAEGNLPNDRRWMMLENLIVTLESNNEKGLALTVRERVYQEQRAKLGANHQLTLTTANALVVSYFNAGQMQKASELGKKVLTARTAILGANHQDTKTSSENLAAIDRRLTDAVTNSVVNKNPIEIQQAQEQERHVKALLSSNQPPSSVYAKHGDVRQEVSNTKIHPFNSVVLIESYSDTEGGRCSGAAVLNVRVIATAAHCVAGRSKHLVKIIDSKGSTIDEVSATVFATGSSKFFEMITHDSKGYAKLNSSNAEKAGIGELYWPQSGLMSNSRREAMTVGQDWAVLVLARELKGISALPIMTSINDYFKYQSGYKGLVTVGFPGDWPKLRMVVTQCPIGDLKGPAGIQALKNSNGIDMHYVFYSNATDGCIGFNGHSGGPLLLFDKVLGAFLFAGVYSVSENSEGREMVYKSIRTQQPLNELSVRQYDGFFSDDAGFVYGSQFLRALHSASEKQEPVSLLLSRGNKEFN